MTHHEILTKLTLTYPSNVIYEITMDTVISAIVRRMGEEALDLSAEDLELAKDEVKAVFEDDYDREKDLIAIGIDNWQLVRNL